MSSVSAYPGAPLPAAASSPSIGAPYLRTLQRPKGTWWRLIVTVVLATIGLVVPSLLVVLAFLGLSKGLGFDYNADFTVGLGPVEMLSLNLGLAALIPVAGGIAWGIYGVRPRWLSSHRPGLRWGWLGLCVGMAAIVWSLLAVLATLGALFTRDSPVDGEVLAFIGVVLLTTPLQAAGEEYLFRGVILQGLGATRMPTWLCVGLSALLFATAHLQFQPELFSVRFLLGVAFAYLALKTGGIEAAIAIHTVFNLASLVPSALLEDVEETLDPSGVTWLPAIVVSVLLAIVVPWMLYVMRTRKRDGRWEPAGEVAAVAPAGQWGAAPPGWPPVPSGWQPPPPGWQPPPPGWQPPPSGWQPPPPGWGSPPPQSPPAASPAETGETPQ